MNLRKLRKAEGLTQQALAEKMGVSRSTVAMWETGTDCGMENAQRLAELFGVSLDYLMGRTDDPKEVLTTPTGEDTETYTILSRAARRMTEEEQKKALEMMKVLFSEVFKDED